jgi:probable rRNA maturation factor
LQMEVLVRNSQPEPVDEDRITEIAEKALQVEHFPKPAEISIVLTDDEQMQVLNREYRGKDRPTDILSFSQLEGEPFAGDPEGVVELGDIVISVEMAKRQAEQHGHSLQDEVDLLVAHGVLHLLGYDDETDADAAEMRRHEAKILEEVGHGRVT